MSGLDVVTNTELKTFRSCPRKHYYRYVKLIRPVETAEPLRFGKLWHIGLEGWFRAHPGENPGERLWAGLEAMMNVEHLPPDFVQARALLEGYELVWGDCRFDVLGVEQEFRCPLVNPMTGCASRTYELGGKLDAVVRDLDSGQILLVEHKTASGDIGPGSEYWRRLTIDGQVSIYFDGAASLGHAVDSCLYDVVSKPRHRLLQPTPVEARKYTKKTGQLYKGQRDTDETLPEYLDRIRMDIACNPTRYYQRGTVVRLEQELINARYDAWVTARMIREAQVSHRWPRNPDSCSSWGRTCEFFDVCTGVASLDDPSRFRQAEQKHEELIELKEVA